MKILQTRNSNFYTDLTKILQGRSQVNIPTIDEDVKIIIDNVKLKGDEALFEYSKLYDKSIIDKNNILLADDDKISYKGKIDNEVMNAFRVAIKNIYNFHQKQKPNDYEIINEGVKTSSIWKPIESVGLYIPGGSAVYPSSVIMNVIPAKIAGVERIAVATPSRSNKLDPYILALLDELEICEIYQIGGAQAIAAFAYGTESINPVNKIFGPGNAYVASAKKQVFGKVGIDLIAGPSEIVVVADKNNNSMWVAADLIAQAEHDEKAQSILITDDENFSNEVLNSIDSIISKLPKHSIIQSSLKNYGIIIVDDSFSNTSDIINFIGPEHLHLQNSTKDKI